MRKRLWSFLGLLAILSAIGCGYLIAQPEPIQAFPAGAICIDGSPIDVCVNSDMSAVPYYLGLEQFWHTNSGGTFIQLDGRAYGPTTMFNGVSFRPLSYTAISNIGPMGSGTAAAPWQITTLVRAGDILVEQVTSYVNGNSYYDHKVTLTNTGSTVHNVNLVVAADFNLALGSNNPDLGFGFRDPSTGAVGGETLNREYTQVLIPLTSASRYHIQDQAFWDRIWDLSQNAPTGFAGFTNFIDTSYHDTEGGLLWERFLKPGQSEVIDVRGAFGQRRDIPIATSTPGPTSTPAPTASPMPTNTPPPMATSTPAPTATATRTPPTPIRLTSFKAIVAENRVEMVTGSEIDALEFQVEQYRVRADGSWALIETKRQIARGRPDAGWTYNFLFTQIQVGDRFIALEHDQGQQRWFEIERASTLASDPDLDLFLPLLER